ncbi:hypothetical protein J5N97_006302 [Dioscorea zingiberensis]|uniref:Non-specific serine/threonine protein kinase n=1 Tax=Dioscorea zingiberensis TaxID=325984 RepID=A0A9D5HTI1_9LILI|nr:hypothetical protein J5N97_006302 [Dioscorea zingiberensis]
MNTAGLHGAIPVKLSSKLHKLRYLDLSMNQNLTADCSLLLSGDWRSIEYIDLATNQIYGELPASIGNFTSLVELNFFSNMIEGGIPSSIGKLCNLKTLNLADDEIIYVRFWFANGAAGNASSTLSSGQAPSYRLQDQERKSLNGT